MLELPEAAARAKEISRSLAAKTISQVTPLQSPHKFAWFYGDPMDYPRMLLGKSIDSAQSHGGMVEIHLSTTSLLFSDGVNLRYIKDRSKLPKKHQLLIEFTDATYFCASLQMYGGIVCFQNAEYDNKYYQAAKEKHSPLSAGFSYPYFQDMLRKEKLNKLSAKAFLATEQRIPGLGNGVLQDILFQAKIHPKRKMNSLSALDLEALFKSIKSTLQEMTGKGGRDTEKDLFGLSGGYRTILSKHTVNTPCPVCGTPIQKSSYLGGSIYACPGCQK